VRGQDFLDIPDRTSYTPRRKKEVLIKKEFMDCLIYDLRIPLNIKPCDDLNGSARLLTIINAVL